MSIADKVPEGPWKVHGKWLVQPLNYVDGQAERKVFVVDSTIRSICTSEPGSVITPGQLIEIIAKLEEVGVKSVMLNIDHMGGRSKLAYETAKLAIQQGFERIKFDAGAARFHPYDDDAEWKKQFHEMVDFGIDLTGISYGGDSLEDEGFSGRDEVFSLLHRMCEYMHEQGFPPSVSFNIKPYSSFVLFMEFIREAARAKARYFRVYDTYASMSFHTIERIIRHIRTEFSNTELPLVVHTHNGLGMAVASTCAAAYAGADGVDVAVQGVGTKSGHTDMIETVVALETLYGIRTGIKLNELTALSRLVEQHLGIRAHDRKPIVGRHAFLAEQSMRVKAALEERMSGEEYVVPIAPSLVGGQRTIVWGKNTVKPDVVELRLMELDLPATEANVQAALRALKDELATRDEYPAWLEDDEAARIIRQAVEV